MVLVCEQVSNNDSFYWGERTDLMRFHQQLYLAHPSWPCLLPVGSTLNSDAVWGSDKKLLPSSPMASSSGKEYHDSIPLLPAANYFPKIPQYFLLTKDSFPISYRLIPFLSFQWERKEINPHKCMHYKYMSTTHCSTISTFPHPILQLTPKPCARFLQVVSSWCNLHYRHSCSY